MDSRMAALLLLSAAGEADEDRLKVRESAVTPELAEGEGEALAASEGAALRLPLLLLLAAMLLDGLPLLLADEDALVEAAALLLAALLLDGLPLLLAE